MNNLARRVQRTYVTLMLGNALAGSFIWGINTLFLLDAGLNNAEAFGANAFYTVGMVIFEVPTGVVADTWGRRTSYLLGTVTLAVATFLYWLMWQWNAPFWQWAAISAMLGLGFTFFSGAVEAWLVDALAFAEYEGELEPIFGRGQVATGVAMLGGSVAGGAIAQVTDLGVPYLIRVSVLLVMFVVAFCLMKDHGFTPEPMKNPLRAMQSILRASIDHGLRKRPIRWVMLAAPFALGTGFYAFYAVQPFLIELSGQSAAYSIAGLAAALVAGTQMIGGVVGPRFRKLFKRRTSALVAIALASSAALVLLGVSAALPLALIAIALWGLAFAADRPIRQAYLNDMIPSKQRATVLSFDSLMGSIGGVVFQPPLGRAADVRGYGFSFIAAAVIALFSVPFLWASRREQDPADRAVAMR